MFEFTWPWIFLLAPLPWLLRRWLPVADSGEAALNVSFLPELEALAGRRARANLAAWQQQLPFALIWLLLLLAAARPEWVGEPLPLAASGRDLMVAVDVSGSMEQRDMQWQGQDVDRLSLVKHLFSDFIEQRRGDRVGLILFGSQAYLQAPLTFDRHTVRTWLDEAVIGIAGKNTAIGDAIGLAVKRLRQRPSNSRVLILITDGANTAGAIEPLTATRLAAEQEVKIYTIGIGSDPDAGMLSMFGLNPGSDLDEPTLKAIASQTGGQYFRLACCWWPANSGPIFSDSSPCGAGGKHEQPRAERAMAPLVTAVLAAAAAVTRLAAVATLAAPATRRALAKLAARGLSSGAAQRRQYPQ